METLKILQKHFGESTLSGTQVFERHKAFSEGCECKKKTVLENCRVGSREIA